MVAPDFSCISNIMWFVKCRLPLYRRRPISFGSLLWSHFVLITTKNHNSYILVEAFIYLGYTYLFYSLCSLPTYLYRHSLRLSQVTTYVHYSYYVVPCTYKMKSEASSWAFFPFKIYFRIIIMHPCLVSQNSILLAPIYYIFAGGDTEK